MAFLVGIAVLVFLLVLIQDFIWLRWDNLKKLTTKWKFLDYQQVTTVYTRGLGQEIMVSTMVLCASGFDFKIKEYNLTEIWWFPKWATCLFIKDLFEK